MRIDIIDEHSDGRRLQNKDPLIGIEHIEPLTVPCIHNTDNFPQEAIASRHRRRD